MTENRECPYLLFNQSLSCASCTGYYCTCYGRRKKLSDTELCKGEYWECPRYIDVAGVEEPFEEEAEALEASVEESVEASVAEEEAETQGEQPCGCSGGGEPSSCPYQGEPPAGAHSSTGLWCYARGKPIRVAKTCLNYRECTVYLMSKYMGVPYR